jgi:Spy/CpxP family protein refolding chaperone
MMTTRWLTLALLLVAAPALQAQQEGARAGQLRREIEERFTQRVQEDLALTDRQTDRLREVARRYFDRRRDMEVEERRLRQSLASELRPGVAANNDRVQQLTDQIMENKVRYVESYREELKELRTFLSPVQCAQFIALRERLLDRVREAQENPPRRRPLRNN